MLKLKLPTSMLFVLAVGYTFLYNRSAAEADVINFDNVAPGFYTNLTIGPFRISHVSVDDRNGDLPSPAAATTTRIGPGGTLTIERLDGQPFLLTSFEVEGSLDSGSVTSVSFEIYGYGEDEVLNGIDDDGDQIVDEPDQILFTGELTDAVPGLESFSFVGPLPHRQWAFGVSPSQTLGSQLHFDNINAVPEPGTFGILFAGMFATCSLARRRRSVMA